MANLVKNGNFDFPNIATATGDVPDFWSRSGGGGIIDFSVAVRGNVPSAITQYVFMMNTIAQNITFPTEGNYVLSFWAEPGSSSQINLESIQFNIGSVVSKRFLYQTTAWVQYVIPFYVSSKQLTQELRFNDITQTNINAHFTGVSIVSTDYTLDLYLEWIPDEEVKKNYKNIQ